jgi:putative acetyltransferase
VRRICQSHVQPNKSLRQVSDALPPAMHRRPEPPRIIVLPCRWSELYHGQMTDQDRSTTAQEARGASRDLPLRHALNSDGGALADLIAACFSEYPGCLFVLDEFPELQAPADWAASRGTRLWVVDRPSGGLAGCVAATPGPGHAVELHKFYVAASLRGSGLADQLFAEVRALARETYASEIVLWSDTRFARAHRFYEKRGFVRQPETRLLHDISDTVEFHYRLRLKP